jgi:hypothetical protein
MAMNDVGDTRFVLGACGVLTLLALGTVCGCDTAGQDIGEALKFNTPSPTQAAGWMFHRDAEKRRLGISLISNSPFGGEEPYMKVYREAIVDVDPMVRAASAHALGLHGQPEDAPLLATALTDTAQLVRWESAKGLQRIYNDAAVAPLIEAAVNDADVDVRMAAATALGQYKERRVIEALIRGLDDRSLGVAFHARRSLNVLTGENFGTNPVAWLEWSRNVSEPFAKGRVYTYPVYTRDRTLLETITPFGRKTFEEPGVPAGYPDAASAAPSAAPGS